MIFLGPYKNRPQKLLEEIQGEGPKSRLATALKAMLRRITVHSWTQCTSFFVHKLLGHSARWVLVSIVWCTKPEPHEHEDEEVYTIHHHCRSYILWAVAYSP